MRRRLPADLQAACAIAYTYGWRMRSEVLTLRPIQLDLKAGTLRLEPGMTKNDDGRLPVYHTPELTRLLNAQVARVEGLGRQLEPACIIPHLFPHFTGTATRRPGTRGRCEASHGASFGRPGRPRARRPAAQGCSGMTSAARPPAT